MFKRWRSINIVQFFGLIDNCFDIRTLQESNFSDDFFEGNLLLCKIVMSHMSDCFEAVGERNVSLFPFMLVGEPLEDLLIFNIFVVQLDFSRLNNHLRPMLLWNVFNAKVAADEDKLFLRIACDDPLVT